MMRQSRLGYVFLVWGMVLATVAVSAEENRGRNYYDLGIFAFEEGNYKAAERHFKMALGADPDLPQYNYRLGRTYLRLGKLKAAKRHLDAAWIIDPEISGLRYYRGLWFYKQENYSQASQLFIQAAKDEPDDVLTNYYAGLSLFREERYGQAIGYFDLAEQLSPSVKDNALFYNGICYRKIGKIFQARQNFIFLQAHAESPYMQQQAQRWLEAMTSAKKVEKPYSLYAKLGGQYDDNVRLRSSDISNLLDDTGTTASDDSDFDLIAFLSGRVDLLTRDKFKMGIGYSHYQTLHQDLSQYDLMGAIPTLYTAYRMKAITLYVSYLPSFYWLDSEKFLTRQQVRPELSWELSDEFTARFTYNYYNDDHQLDEGRTGDTHELFTEIFYNPVDQTILLSAGAGFAIKSAKEDHLSYSRFQARAGIDYTTHNKFELAAKLNYFNTGYDKKDPAYKTKRDENRIEAKLSLSRTFLADWLKWMFEYKRTQNDSKIDELDYDSNAYCLSMVAHY